MWQKIRVAGAGFIVLVGLSMGCLAPGTRHGLLNAFFDGVPSPARKFADQGATAEQKVAADEGPRLTEHKPYAEKECGKCHNERQSFVLLVEKSKLCLQCHSGEKFKGAYVHGPASSGQCYACHEPHKSFTPHLLIDTAEGSICQHCHSSSTYAALDEHIAQKGKNCLECHDPHAADNPSLLRVPGNAR